MNTLIRRIRLPALVIALAATLAACGSSSSSSSSSAGTSTSSSAATSSASAGAYPAASETKGAKVDLAGVCPSTVTIQTDWDPEADHGSTYEMLGPNAVIDTGRKSVTSDLYANGQPTGIKLEIRAGGPAIGYQTVSSQMYEDKSITLGYVNTDESIEFSDKLPTTAVFAEDNISPQIIEWDPKEYPNVKTIKQLGPAVAKEGSAIYYYSGAAYMDYLIGAGYFSAKETDGSYNGTPTAFVEAQGKEAQQGFLTYDPYLYAHEVQAWDKPIADQLIYNTGWQPYPEPLSVRTGALKQLTPCLKKLVPVLQQADVDFLANPTSTNTFIDNLVNKYNNGWAYDIHVGDYAAQTMNKLERQQSIPYVGYMSSSRINTLIKKAVPIFAATKGAGVKSGVTAADVSTDQFMSRTVKLGGS